MTCTPHSIATRTGIAPTSTGTRSCVARTAGAGLVAGTVGAAVLFVYGTLVGSTSVPLRAGDPWSDSAVAVTPANFSAGVLVCTFWGTILAIVLTVAGRRPARTFVLVSTVLVAASLAFPLAAVDTATSTKLVLAIGHLIAAAVVVPLLARGMPGTRR